MLLTTLRKLRASWAGRVMRSMTTYAWQRAGATAAAEQFWRGTWMATFQVQQRAALPRTLSTLRTLTRPVWVVCSNYTCAHAESRAPRRHSQRASRHAALRLTMTKWRGLATLAARLGQAKTRSISPVTTHQTASYEVIASGACLQGNALPNEPTSDSSVIKIVERISDFQSVLHACSETGARGMTCAGER